MKIINNELIRSFRPRPCYDPSEKEIPDNETLPVLEWVEKYRNTVPAKDILWLLLRNEFLSDKDLRLFAVWCVREALKLVENTDIRSITACDVAERFANGAATESELKAAEDAARTAATSQAAEEAATAEAAEAAVCAAVEAAVDAVISAAAWAAESMSVKVINIRELQLNHLITYFK